jgi:hypothetical protein
MKDLIEQVLDENRPVAISYDMLPAYLAATERHQEALSQLSRMNDIIKTQRRLLERIDALSLHQTGEVGLLARKMTQEAE